MALAHERLIVYQKSIELVAWSQKLMDSLESPTAAKNQLERASNSVPLNIAEGNGKFSRKDQSRFLQIAQGSAFECAACLDVLVAREFVTIEEIEYGKTLVEEIVRMLMGLISNRRETGVGEDAANYGLRFEGDEDEDEDEDEE